MTKGELFISLAGVDENGVTPWVNVSQFIGRYSRLKFTNGGDWCRASSALAKKYIVETDKTLTPGPSIDRIRLNGFNKNKSFNQSIRKDIKDYYKDKNCVMLGINGKSENTKIEIDHKDGRKDNDRVSNLKTQRLQDFQPLCKAANDVKRQICKRCRETNKRWDAKNIAGNPYSFYKGDEIYTKKLGCVGCYQYDPVAYRKESIKKISEETVQYMAKKLFGE